MAGKMLRAVAFDLDNTLLRDDKSVSDYTVRVLKELHRRGTAIIPSTGRALYRVTPYCEMLGCADYVISLNGAQVFRVRNSVSEGRKLSNEVILGTAELIHKETMSPADAAGMIRYMAPYISYARAFVDDETLQQTFIPGDMPFIQKLYFYHTFDFEEFGDLAGYLEKTDRTIWKVAGFFTDHKKFELLKSKGTPFPEVFFYQSDELLMEASSVRASKGLGLKWLMEHLGAGRDETAAFGDNWNDAPMFEYCNIGVGIGNGNPEFLKEAAYIADTNENDGVARFLNDWCGLGIEA